MMDEASGGEASVADLGTGTLNRVGAELFLFPTVISNPSFGLL